MYLEISKIDNFKNLFNVFSTLKFSDWVVAVIEVLIIAFVIYKFLIWVMNTRSWTLLRGIIVIALFIFIAWFFTFSVILEILSKIALYVPILFVIIFQEEIRNGIDHLGRQKFFLKIIPDLNKLTKKTSQSVVQEIVEAVFAMGVVKTGALIVIEKNESLEEVERTGIEINGKVSKQLLINIFEKNTPLHDGAVLIVGDIIKAATCYLPLTRNARVPKEFGTRHRAALGVSEISDSQTIVVSEETGHISLCSNGRIKLISDEKELVKELVDTIYAQENKKEKNFTDIMKGWFKNEK